MALNTVQIDPLKYLSKLPTYDGNFTNLYTFIDLIDRIGTILETYDELSQSIFLDLIKSKLIGPAKDISDINNHLTSWGELKEVLINNFGDRLSAEQLYDQMRSLRFKTNAKSFYDEIITTLRRLNMKTRTIHQNEVGYNALVAANKRTALEIFRNKLIEPMRSIIICRNPNNIENAIKILFDTNYAYYSPNPNQNKNDNNQKPNQTKNDNNRDSNRNDGNPNQNRKKHFYRNRHDDHYGHQNTFLSNRVENGNHNQLQPPLQNFQPNYQNFNNPNNGDRPMPMEVGNFHRDDLTNSPI